METIEKAAIQFEDGIVVMVDRPGRHHNIIHALAKLGMDTPIGGEHGFVTSTGRFVDRIEAAQIALDAKQIEKLSWPPNLYTEDLW